MAITPKDFMKSRRPEKFSDSRIITNSKLNRTILEYHLDSLGSRKQEKDFEEFSRKLCQYEICPNIRPQTGSTGGGDSKIDSSTIPVASQIRISFFQGLDNQNKENFAFAFSTQKDWSGKIKGDVYKIFNTKRDFAKIYCITSQYARDKTRADLEDELTKKYSIQVVILDRAWILDKVFGNKREKLAIDELKLGEGLDEKNEIGPLDFQRKKHAEELSSSIEDDISQNRITINTVDDCLNLALISAYLEKSRQDVESQFDQSIRMAKTYGTKEQYFTALYNKAWTSFFWFEDFKLFVQLYNDIEDLAIESDNIFNAERLNNLYNLLTIIGSTTKFVTFEVLNEKTKNLQNKLIEFRENKNNTSASFHAEQILCFINLLKFRNDSIELNKTFQQLKILIDNANNLIGFPIEVTFQILNDLGDYFSGEKAYEELQDYFVEMVTKRKGDLSAAELLLNRGKQHLKARRIYNSIDSLGKSLLRFHKQESRDSLVHALFIIAIAYEEAGLLWAARSSLLSAASLSTNDFWIYSKINAMQLACFKRLKHIELQLGRIGYALEWHQLHLAFASQLIKTDQERDKLLDETLYFSSVLGLLLIKTPDDQLKSLERLPDTLFKFDLDFSALGLIYRLGGKDLLPKSFIDNLKIENVEGFFNSWLHQPAQKSLPEFPDFYSNNIIELKSIVLGCVYTVRMPNSSPEIEIGEFVLSALECFLSTTLNMGAVSRISSVDITILRDTNQKDELNFEVIKDGPIGIIIYANSFNPHSLLAETQQKIASVISDILINLIPYSVCFNNPMDDLHKLFKDEEVASRAFNFSSPMVQLGNLLGNNPKRSILDWLDSGNSSYTYDPHNSGKLVKTKDIKFEDQKLEKESFLRHDEIQNLSIIREHLWDKAGWSGMGYVFFPFQPPVLTFLFKNEDKAKAIFKDWKEKFGDNDINEIIRISVIRGFSEEHPFWYRTVISTNLNKTEYPSKSYFVLISRIHTQTSENSINLDRFTEYFKKFGVYLLAPAIIDNEKSTPKVLFDLGIEKKSFNDRQAWEIGLNDLDIAGINDETKPIIPKEVKNAPVLELLNRLDELRNFNN